MPSPTLVASAVGIDLGGTKINARVVDPADLSTPVAAGRVATPTGGSAIVAAIEQALDEVTAQLEPLGRRVGSVGLGAAGLVDDDGIMRFAPNLPGVLDFPFRSELERRLGVPVAVTNDATAATLAEQRLGAGRGSADLLMVSLGTGIGAGFVSGGVLQVGAHGFGGEAGHMVVDPTGPRCPCGRRGCWERFASGSGLGRLAREAVEAGQAAAVVELAGGDPAAVRGEHVGLAAAAGDGDAREVLRAFAWWVALGIANLVNVLDCEVVVVGGGLVDLGDLLLEPVRNAFDELVLAARHRPSVRIVAATLGSDAAAVGAWLLADDLLAVGRRG